MGFYLDLVPYRSKSTEFREISPPAYFWIFYGIGLFALLCMALAAHQVLGDLAKENSVWDKLLIGSFGLAFVALVFGGIKLLGMRKFVKIEADEIGFGFLFFKRVLFQKRLSRSAISRAELMNKRPAPNLAPQMHQDPQYYVRGHWRVVLVSKTGQTFVLDRHVEKEALLPLHQEISAWLEKV